MNSAVRNQPSVSSSPGRDDFVPARRPLIGLGLLLSSVIFSVAVLIYFGAWASADRIENRALAAGATSSSETNATVEGEWWEDGLIFVCPLH